MTPLLGFLVWALGAAVVAFVGLWWVTGGDGREPLRAALPPIALGWPLAIAVTLIIGPPMLAFRGIERAVAALRARQARHAPFVLERPSSYRVSAAPMGEGERPGDGGAS